MIITQTPLRTSLAGGGTDFAEYFRRDGTAFIGTAIERGVEGTTLADIYLNSTRDATDILEQQKERIPRKIAVLSRLRAELSGYRELPFQLEPDGGKVIFNVRRYSTK